MNLCHSRFLTERCKHWFYHVPVHLISAILQFYLHLFETCSDTEKFELKLNKEQTMYLFDARPRACVVTVTSKAFMFL